jgi:hypothetical protein
LDGPALGQLLSALEGVAAGILEGAIPA